MRNTFGHWEMDSVMGTVHSKAALVVLTERLTRYGLIFRVPDHTMASVVKVLDRLERKLGKKVQADIPDDNRGQRLRVPGLRRDGAVAPPPDTPDENILLPSIQRQRTGKQRKHEPDRPPFLPQRYQLRRSNAAGGRQGGSVDEQLPQGHPGLAFSRSGFLRAADRLNSRKHAARSRSRNGAGRSTAPISRANRQKTSNGRPAASRLFCRQLKFLQIILSYS